MNTEKSEDILKGKAEAEKVLEANFIDAPPVVVHELVENYGLAVFIASFEDKNVSGYMDFDKKWIVLNKEDSTNRQNFTIAHELGHWIMHPDLIKNDEKIRIVYRKPIGGESDPIEVQANAFAAHLLVPDKLLNKYKDKGDLELAHIFQVSQSVIGFRRINARG